MQLNRTSLGGLLSIMAILATHLYGGSLSEKYQPAADQIIHKALHDEGAWQKLETLCKKYPKRLSGSKALEDAVQWAFEKFRVCRTVIDN